jgi:hypothetical protein
LEEQITGERTTTVLTRTKKEEHSLVIPHHLRSGRSSTAYHYRPATALFSSQEVVNINIGLLMMMIGACESWS